MLLMSLYVHIEQVTTPSSVKIDNFID